MSNVRKCDNCGIIGKWGDVKWLTVRDETLEDDEAMPFINMGIAGERYDYCSWQCLADYASLKALERQMTSD